MIEVKEGITVANILEGIRNSKLEDGVKADVIKTVQERSADIEKTFTSRRKIEGEDFERTVTNTVMYYIVGPVLAKYNISPIIGLNVYKDIYESIGGKRASKYIEKNLNSN
jgi:hypothetical protein